MGVVPAVLWWTVLVLVARSAAGERDNFTDIIIGEQKLAENDILGASITEEEFKASLALEITEPDEDPIAKSGYFQGDIMIESKDHLMQILEGDPKGQHSAISNKQLVWPGGVIPYVISSSYSSSERQVIARAMTELSSKTCLTFVPRSSHLAYVHILRGQGCSSAVGRSGGVQTLSLGSNCVYVGIVMHELMHAAGFWHEQSRYDRDSYVTINWQNIMYGLAYNFDKKSNGLTTDLGLPYDYASIMHYGPNAFSRGTGPTIVPRQSGVYIGQRKQLSDMDVKGLNLLYQCSGTTGPQPSTPAPPSSCKDTSQYCAVWSAAGYCLSTPVYMKTYCPKSCNVCGGVSGCRDEGQHCLSWAAQGECQRNPQFMQEKCRRSCNACASPSSCRDVGQHCSSWAGQGECARNPGYMSVMCRKSCGMC
ncbi:zinc metalloproteinase nas-15-like [Eriocheir sinensis]|uniref:zinc metalloproteinase nas-15-like n=1 Tax=Eriocheir sinensis TaxID=95602 RepID=UPI0021C69124|nr:zinc metalloproteinase nas-15-like [Eriocheir sinensis]